MKVLRNPSTGRAAGQVATVAFGLAILGQLLLLLGVLPISWAWGGGQSILKCKRGHHAGRI